MHSTTTNDDDTNKYLVVNNHFSFSLTAYPISNHNPFFLFNAPSLLSVPSSLSPLLNLSQNILISPLDLSRTGLLPRLLSSLSPLRFLKDRAYVLFLFVFPNTN